MDFAGLLLAPGLLSRRSLDREVVLDAEGDVDGVFLCVVADSKATLEVASAIAAEAELGDALVVEQDGVFDHTLGPIRQVAIDGDFLDWNGYCQRSVAGPSHRGKAEQSDTHNQARAGDNADKHGYGQHV